MSDSFPGLPEVEPRDPEPVAVAIETARALFRTGERLDALRWLRRAAERAEEAGDDVRSVGLARCAADLSTELQSMAPSPPPPVQAPRAPSMPPPPPLSVSRPPVVAPRSSSAPPPPSAPLPPFAPSPDSAVTSPPPTSRRTEDGAIALGAYDDFSDKTIVDGATAPIVREALQSGVHITELPQSAPRSVTMPSPSSSIPVVGTPAPSPLNLATVAAKPALRQAQRVAVSPDPNNPGGWLVRPLADGSAAPPGTEEALLLALDPKTHLFD
jgi:hypothetical protein